MKSHLRLARQHRLGIAPVAAAVPATVTSTAPVTVPATVRGTVPATATARRASGLALCIIVWFVQPTAAQHQIARSIFGNGGVVVASNSHRMVGTLGQPALGATAGANNGIATGFWTDLNPFTPTDIDPVIGAGSPNRFVLEQNYPNPFSSATRIPFAVAEASHVTLEVFDILGRRVHALIDEALAPGRYEAPLTTDGLVSGIYLYRVRMSDYEETKQMIVVR